MRDRHKNKIKLPLNLLFACWVLIVLISELLAASKQSWNVLDKVACHFSAADKVACHLHLPTAARFTSVRNSKEAVTTILDTVTHLHLPAAG